MKGIKLYRDVRLSASRRRQLDRVFFVILAFVSLAAIAMTALAVRLLTR